MVRALIFGGSGFIGTHLYQYLDSRLKLKTLIADIKPPLVEASEYVELDVRSSIPMIPSINSDTMIYNLAAIHKTPGHPDYEYFETNIKGAENICSFAREHNIQTIVFTSSIAPYGSSESEKNELSLPTPNTPYGISKLVAEEIHKRWQAEDSDKRKLIILRPGVVFGTGEGGNFTRLSESLRGHYFFYPGRKDTLKAAIYVKDLVRLMTEMVDREQPGVYLHNMCYPSPHSIEQIVRTVSKVTGVSKRIPRVPAIALNIAATLLYNSGRLIGKNIASVHPDRIKKLMISTNISGQKLLNQGYKMQFDLEAAIQDWYADNDRKMLK